MTKRRDRVRGADLEGEALSARPLSHSLALTALLSMRLILLLSSLSVVACTQGIPVLGGDGGSDTPSDGGSDAPLVCPGGDGCPACNNGRDDDGDSRTDYPSDPGCTDRDDRDEAEPPPAGPCADGVDNDSDRLVDYPDDPGCADEEDLDETDPLPPACDDGDDDDGDGLVDYPEDPGCTGAGDLDEADTCPGTCPACSNGLDDDGDGAADYPDDPECGSASDDDERCALLGNGFEDAWPGAFQAAFGTVSPRRLSAAHDGTYGLLSPMDLVYDPTVITGASGETVSAWMRSFGTSPTVLALHFGLQAGGASYACMFDLADHLTMYELGPGGLSETLASTSLVRDLDAWYRVEVTFGDGDLATCTATREGATSPAATVSHTFARSLSGPVGVRGFPVSAFDTIEVCR